MSDFLEIGVLALSLALSGESACASVGLSTSGRGGWCRHAWPAPGARGPSPVPAWGRRTAPEEGWT